MTTNPATEPTEPTTEPTRKPAPRRAPKTVANGAARFAKAAKAPEPSTPEPATPEPSKPTTRKPRTPAKSGDPRVDRARAESVTTKAAKGKATRLPRAKVAAKAATPKPIVTDKGWVVALTHNQAHVAYRKQRALLHGAGPEAYRKAAAKALGIEDEAFLAAFYVPKTEGK